MRNPAEAPTRDPYIEAALKFVKGGKKPDPRLGVATGSSIILERYDPAVAEDIRREREHSRPIILSVLRRAS